MGGPATRLRTASWALAGLALALGARPAAATPEVVAVKAGTVHSVVNGRTYEGGATVLVADGKIVAVGNDVAVPPSARVVDYGPHAVVVPGFVAADSNYGSQGASERTADPTVRAVDQFDPYASYLSAVSAGVTTAYLPPARARLIAGQGAVVKLAGEPGPGRVIDASASIHGSIAEDARNTRGYWEPPVPATVDVGLGVERPQLPRTTMGAIAALNELLALARSGADSEDYGPLAGPELAALMQAGTPWRMTAMSAGEVRALLGFFEGRDQRLVLDAAYDLPELAAELAAAGVPVVVRVPLKVNSSGRDHGKEEDARWPEYGVAPALAAAGVSFAVVPEPNVPLETLRLSAALAAGGELDPRLALRSITLSAAELLGVDERVGSLAPGKDADLVVLSGDPMDLASNVVATWVGGQLAFDADESEAVVLEVDELHVGDGTVLAPGQLLMLDGRIAEVGRRVAHPLGATVVRGAAAMPGMIDALGYLGLERSTKVPPTDFALSRLVEPGDRTDRRVALSGVTTVALAPRGTGRGGSPMMAYKPAGTEPEQQVVADPVALRFDWTEANRTESGDNVRKVLAKLAEYVKSWEEYEKAMAEWTPPPPEAADDEESKEDEASDEEKGDGEADAKDGEDEKGKKDKKDKKKKDEEPEPAPVTGIWEGALAGPDGERVRLQVRESEDLALEAWLRCDALSAELVELTGERDGFRVKLAGPTEHGWLRLTGEARGKAFEGKAHLGESTHELALERTADEVVVVKRPELAPREKPEKKDEPKGKPKEPKIDKDLEPLRAAQRGEVAVLVNVNRADEIVACAEAFAEAGIRPILYEADGVHDVVDEIRDKVAGVVLSTTVVQSKPETGIARRNRYAELQSAGIPVAFHSNAEEGASDLPLTAAYAVSMGMSPEGAMRALTSDAAKMYAVDGRIGRLAVGLDADVLLLDQSPLRVPARVVRAWVNGEEIRE